MRILSDFELGAVAAGSIHGQDDPTSWDGNDDDPCGGIENDNVRDGCRAAIAVCGPGNVKKLDVTSGGGGGGSVEVSVRKTGGQVTGTGGGDSRTTIECKDSAGNDSGSNDSGSGDSGS